MNIRGNWMLLERGAFIAARSRCTCPACGWRLRRNEAALAISSSSCPHCGRTILTPPDTEEQPVPGAFSKEELLRRCWRFRNFLILTGIWAAVGVPTAFLLNFAEAGRLVRGITGLILVVVLFVLLIVLQIAENWRRNPRCPECFHRIDDILSVMLSGRCPCCGKLIADFSPPAAETVFSPGPVDVFIRRNRRRYMVIYLGSLGILLSGLAGAAAGNAWLIFCGLLGGPVVLAICTCLMTLRDRCPHCGSDVRKWIEPLPPQVTEAHVIAFKRCCHCGCRIFRDELPNDGAGPPPSGDSVQIHR